MKKVIKSFDDKIDDLLIHAFKQKENITYAARQKREIREELTRETLCVCMKASVYFYQISDIQNRYIVDRNISYFRKQSEVVFPNRIGSVLTLAAEHIKELKPFGLNEKDLQRIEELKKQYQKIVSQPRLLQCSRSTTTDSIKKGLKELDTMQCKVIDKIAKSFFEPGVLKNEYRRARKIVQHKNPEGMFDEMLRIYRGGKKKKKVSRKQVLSNIIKDAAVMIS